MHRCLIVGERDWARNLMAAVAELLYAEDRNALDGCGPWAQQE
jgi:hypothetical protein